jgi:hypothetical protein
VGDGYRQLPRGVLGNHHTYPPEAAGKENLGASAIIRWDMQGTKRGIGVVHGKQI